MESRNSILALSGDGKRPRDLEEEEEERDLQSSPKRGKASPATASAKPDMGPKSIVTGDPYLHGANDNVILDKFKSLKKANDVNSVVAANYIVTAKDVEGMIPESGLFRNSESMSMSTTGSVPASNTKAYQVEVEPKAIEINQVLREEAVLRIMKKVLPTETKVSEDCLKHMQQCAAKFIGMVGSEAGMVTLCEPAPQRVATDCTGSRIVKGADVIEAMNGLGYADYAKVTSLHLTKFQVQKKPPHLVYKPPQDPAPSSHHSAHPKTYEELMTAEAALISAKETATAKQRPKKYRK